MLSVAAIVLLSATAFPGEKGPHAPDSAVTQEARRRAEVSRVAGAKVGQLSVLAGNKNALTAVLRPEPLLRFSNPTIGSVYGEVFLWTVAERPAAIGSIYQRYDRPSGWIIELVSTSELPIRACENDETLWQAEPAGINFRSCPDSAPPSAKAATRLGQMRRLAERFTAEILDRRNDDEVDRRLRLLPQPVYRYSAGADHVIDGALFAFVVSTDPDMWLLVEAVDADDEADWRYALARSNSAAMQARLDDQVVQTWDKLAQPWLHRKAPYTCFPFAAVQPDVETERAAQ